MCNKKKTKLKTPPAVLLFERLFRCGLYKIDINPPILTNHELKYRMITAANEFTKTG